MRQFRLFPKNTLHSPVSNNRYNPINFIRPLPGGHTTSDYIPNHTYTSTHVQEQLQVANKHGVQGRLNNHIGHTMNIIAKTTQENFRFGDFQATQETYIKTPDSVIMGKAGTFIVVIEAKTPWIQTALFIIHAIVCPCCSLYLTMSPLDVDVSGENWSMRKQAGSQGTVQVSMCLQL